MMHKLCTETTRGQPTLIYGWCTCGWTHEPARHALFPLDKIKQAFLSHLKDAPPSMPARAYAVTRMEALRLLRNEGYAIVDREGYEALRREVDELREVMTDPVAIANILLDVKGVYAHNDKWLEDDGSQLPAAIAIPRDLARELFFSREPRQPCPDCAGTGAENRVTGKGPCVVCGGSGVTHG